MKMKSIVIIKVVIVAIIFLRITQHTKDEATQHPFYAEKHVIRTDDLVDCQYRNLRVNIMVDNCQQYERNQSLLVTGTTPPWLKKDPKSIKPVTVLEIRQISNVQADWISFSNRLNDWQANFRNSIMSSLTQVMPEEYATFTLLLVFGGSLSEFGQETKEIIVASGLAHVVAASGMNVAFVLVIAGLWRSQPRFLQVLLSSILVMIYAFLAGGEPPVVRAALGAILLVAGSRIWLKSANPLYLLLASAAIQLLLSPALMASISFQLSYAASFGILALFPLVDSRSIFRPLTKLHLCRSENKTLITTITAYIRTTLLITICCWVMVAPLLAYSFGTVTLTTIISGLLTTWLVPLAFILSTGTIVVGWFSQLLPGIQLVLGAQAQLLMLLESFFFWSARLSASFDSLQKNWTPALWQVVVWYAVILISWWRLTLRSNVVTKPLLPDYD